ncbi:MAG: hypothetical protein IT335_04180 [Thermomicrobiales bacterium]|nr:hypothetical protein [Thermomicrobiales bacterium]
MSESSLSTKTPGRRDLMKAGAGALAALAGARTVTSVRAQDGTPEVPAGRDLNGHYGVTRTYVVAEDADLDALIAIVEEYATIIAASPGFAAYSILYNDETRVWTAVSLFDTAEHAAASTESAASFVAEHDLGGYFEDPAPVVVDGRVIINRGF